MKKLPLIITLAFFAALFRWLLGLPDSDDKSNMGGHLHKTRAPITQAQSQQAYEEYIALVGYGDITKVETENGHPPAKWGDHGLSDMQ